MDGFGINDLRRLTAVEAEPCVSVYLSTHMGGQDGQQDRVRLKNLVHQVEEQLAKQWLRPAEARKLMQPVNDFPADPAFWDDRSRGLAIFVSPSSFDRFRLGLEFDELAMVDRRFHVKPLFRVLGEQDRCFLLTLSQNNIRFFRASRYQVEQVDVKGLPANMNDALNYTGADRGSQAHSAMQGSLGKQAAVFHGHGGQQDTRKVDLAAFFRQVDAVLKPVLREQRLPLLLAGVEYVLSIYREVNHYPHLAEQQLEGNCDPLTPHELRERTWPLMASIVGQARHRAAERYVELVSSGKTSDDINRIIPAAHEGRIDTLFVDEKAHQWGTFDPELAAVGLHQSCQSGDDELLDLAAVQTLLHRGSVHCLGRDQIPGRTPIAALFRY